jgi:hypothetical protein
MRPSARPIAPLLLAALACDPSSGGKGRGEGDSSDGPADTGSPGDTGAPPAEGCRATPPAADADRLVVVSLPYSESGSAAPTWGALRLRADGTLTDPGARFEMGRGYVGPVRFTPDGSLGVAVQDDGTLGVFAVADDLSVSVVDPGWTSGFYAGDVLIDPSGERLWVVDGNWANNGGGVYEVALDCETGLPSDAGFLIESKLAAALVALPGDRAALVGREVGGAPAGGELALLGWPGASVLAESELFSDDDAIVSAVALSPDRRRLLVGDNSLFSSQPNRVVQVDVSGEAPGAPEAVELEDPVGIGISPDGSTALVSSGYGDALELLRLQPLERAGALAVRGDRVQLPGPIAVARRGPVDGIALVTEVGGVRAVRLGADGAADDLGLLSLGAGLDALPSAIGVSP